MKLTQAMALRETPSTAPLYADLKEIIKAANHSADITRQLLAFARKQTISPKEEMRPSSWLKMSRRFSA